VTDCSNLVRAVQSEDIQDIPSWRAAKAVMVGPKKTTKTSATVHARSTEGSHCLQLQSYQLDKTKGGGIHEGLPTGTRGTASEPRAGNRFLLCERTGLEVFLFTVLIFSVTS
jgi:hypothetical protein